ncbi:hypothetical protein RI367_008293 [Sorochytrium milnesiophthora]
MPQPMEKPSDIPLRPALASPTAAGGLPGHFSTPRGSVPRLQSAHDCGASTTESVYKEKTLLPSIARTLHVWGLAIALVVIGEYSGWNNGLQYGWSNLAIAFVLATTMFWLLGNSVAEMSCSLPFAGGPATFAQAAFGHELSAFNGLLFTSSYCIYTAANTVTFGNAISVICNFPPYPNNMQPMLWIVLLQFLLYTNKRPRGFFLLAVVVSIVLCVLLGCFLCLSIVRTPSINRSVYTTPVSMAAVLRALPSAVWFYLGLECIPVSAEECENITITAPKAMKWVLLTLTTLATGVLILVPGLTPSISQTVQSDQPVLDSLFNQLNIPLSAPVVTYVSAFVMALPTFAASHASLYASSRHIYSLARAGYLPEWLSHTYKGSPLNASRVGACVSFAIAIMFFLILSGSGVDINELLLRMTVWFACLAYTVEMIVFVRLRTKLPTLPRPWKSPLGIPGGVAAALINCIEVFGAFAVEPQFYQWLLLGFVVAVVIFAVYFVAFAKKRALHSPEKEFISAQLDRLYRQRSADTRKVSKLARSTLAPDEVVDTRPTPPSEASNIRKLISPTSRPVLPKV